MSKNVKSSNRPASPVKVDKNKSYQVAVAMCSDIRRLFRVTDGVIIANGHERPSWANSATN